MTNESSSHIPSSCAPYHIVAKELESKNLYKTLKACRFLASLFYFAPQ